MRNEVNLNWDEKYSPLSIRRFVHRKQPENNQQYSMLTGTWIYGESVSRSYAIDSSSKLLRLKHAAIFARCL